MRFANDADNRGKHARRGGHYVATPPMNGTPRSIQIAGGTRLTQLFRAPELPPLAAPPAPPVPSPALLSWSPNRSMFNRFTPMPPRPAPPLPPSPPLPPRPLLSPPVCSSDM